MKCPAQEELLQPLQALAGVQGAREWLCHPESLTPAGRAPNEHSELVLSSAGVEGRLVALGGLVTLSRWSLGGGGAELFPTTGFAFLPASTASEFPFNIPPSSPPHDSQGMLLCFIATTLMKRPLQPRLLW